MSSTIHALTPARRIKKPFYSTVATWVKESWDEVDEDLIRRSFKCCGISTNTDGSDDNDLFDYDKLFDMPEDEDEVDLEDNFSDEDIEENDYENEWKIRMNKGKNNEINCSNDNSKGEDRNQN